MLKFITTEDFSYKRLSAPGIPLILNDSEIPHTVLNNFMFHLVYDQGSVESIQTLHNYADALIDYFSWLDANELSWDDKPRLTQKGKESSNLALYQRWSEKDYRKPNGYPLSPATINQRTGRVQAFYRWAKDIARLIDWLPYATVLKARPQRHPDAFAHMHAKQYVESSSLKLKLPKKLPKLLTMDECRKLLAAPMSKTVRTMTRLMLGTGIRNEECRTFPRKYVFDPTRLNKHKRIRIKLDPQDMNLKNNKERVIYMSWQLMAHLHEYTQFGEGVERETKYRERLGVMPPMLFLSERGMPWSEKGLNGTYRKFWTGYKRYGNKYPPFISFRVTPHMLRHTFATNELYHEQNMTQNGRKKGIGHALAWVRDRLGHSSIQTTTIYVHCLDIMDDGELNEYQQELDHMMIDEGTYGS
ncbi:MAG: site-specific integrase [Anaerolineaceae bacterium]|nr:site-specific integrase [Anaerolineaceae bacterium]